MDALWPSERELALLTDLYELTMAQAYWRDDHRGEAVFSLFFRKLPAGRRFAVACGQEYAAHLIRGLRFYPEQIERLRQLELFEDAFLRWLADFRFEGEVRALPEGSVVFPNEPLLEVRAPVIQGQLLESLLMNYVNLETLLASKAARMVLAADGVPVVDFGMRRMHGLEAAWRGVRAYRVAGIAGTSNVLGGLSFDLPVRGTMAHSYIQSHDDETEALRRYARDYPGTTLLVDTYDTLRGVDRVIALVRDEGLDVGAVRIDSGDLGELAAAGVGSTVGPLLLVGVCTDHTEVATDCGTVRHGSPNASGIWIRWAHECWQVHRGNGVSILHLEPPWPGTRAILWIHLVVDVGLFKKRQAVKHPGVAWAFGRIRRTSEAIATWCFRVVILRSPPSSPNANSDWESTLNVMVVVQCQNHLLQVVLTLSPACSLASLLYSRKQERDQNCNDRNHDQ